MEHNLAAQRLPRLSLDSFRPPFSLALQHPKPHLEPILETIWESCSTAFRHCCDRRTAQEEDHATSLSFLPNHGFNFSFVTFCTLQRIARFVVHKGQPNWKAIIVPRQPFNLNPCTVKQAQKKSKHLPDIKCSIRTPLQPCIAMASCQKKHQLLHPLLTLKWIPLRYKRWKTADSA